MMVSSYYCLLTAGLFAATSVLAAPYPVNHGILEPPSGGIHPRDSSADRYLPSFVPHGINTEGREIYHKLQKIAPTLEEKVHLVVFTDTAVDYDDFCAEAVFSELQHLGFFEVEAVISNLGPTEETVKKRVALNAWGLNEFGLKETLLGRGTLGEDPPKHKERRYEFAGVKEQIKPFMNKHDEEGAVVLRKVIAKANDKGFKLTILALSSLMDLGKFVAASPEPATQEGTQETTQKTTEPATQEGTQETTEKFSKDGENLAKVLKHVVLQGGYKVSQEELTPDFAAQNNRFSVKYSKIFHKFLKARNIPSTVYTKDAAYVTADHMEDGLLAKLAKTNFGPAVYLHGSQVPQDLVFYKRASYPDRKKGYIPAENEEWRMAEFMDASWFLIKRSTWCKDDSHHCDENAPSDDWYKKKLNYPRPEQPLSADPKDKELDILRPYLNKLTLYDVLAAIGAIGDEYMRKLGLLNLNFEGVWQDKTHKIAGVEIPAETEVVLGKDGEPEKDRFGKVKTKIVKPAVLSVDGKEMAKYAGALLAGAMYRHPGAVQPSP